MSKRLESVPFFASEAEERKFWQTHDGGDHVDWSKARRVVLPHLQPTSKAISLRSPKHLLEAGDGVSPDVETLKLAEALLERLRDMRQHCELMDCLDGMGAGTAADLRACRTQQTT